MPKIIRILRSCSMKIFCKFPTVNISKLNFWLVICIAKNFIWITLKVIFSIFRFFCSLRFQIFKYCPIITNHTSMESYQMMHKSQFWKIVPYDWFCGPGSHIYMYCRNTHIPLNIIAVVYFSCKCNITSFSAGTGNDFMQFHKATQKHV